MHTLINNIIHFVKFIKLTFKLKLFHREFFILVNKKRVQTKKIKKPPKTQKTKIERTNHLYQTPGTCNPEADVLLFVRDITIFRESIFSKVRNQHFLKSGVFDFVRGLLLSISFILIGQNKRSPKLKNVSSRQMEQQLTHKCIASSVKELFRAEQIKNP